MIIFESVEYKNFLSVGNVPIKVKLNAHNLTLVTGKNGSGKSSIIEAITFGLFGKPYRNFNKPQLVNSINQKHCLVTIEFRVGTKQYKVVRGIKPSIFEIYENGILINQNPNIRDYQKILEQQILKMNYKTFTQVVVMGSSSYVPFMRLKSQERREFIEDLLDIRIFSVMNLLLKDKAKSLREELVDLDHSLNILKEKVKLQEKHLKQRKEEKSKLISDLNNEIENFSEKLKEEQKKLISLLEEQNELSSKNFDDVIEQNTELKVLQSRLQKSIEDLKKESGKIISLNECPTCKQPISDKHKNHIQELSEKQSNEIEQQLNDISKKIQMYQSKLKEYEEHTEKIMKIGDNIKEQRHKINSLENLISEKESQIEKIKQASSFESDQNLLKEFAKAIVIKTNKKKELLLEQQYQSAISSFLQDSGIKAKIIKQYIPLINKHINKYLDSLDLFVGFHLDENFNETIKSRYRDTFTYESFSDGQKRRIDAALLLTWRDIAKSKNSINTNLLFLDEADAAMDGPGADTLLELFKVSKIQNIFVISHKEQLANHADHVIELELKNNFTQIMR